MGPAYCPLPIVYVYCQLKLLSAQATHSKTPSSAGVPKLASRPNHDECFGYHAKARHKTILVYSRDSMAWPLRHSEKVPVVVGRGLYYNLLGDLSRKGRCSQTERNVFAQIREAVCFRRLHYLVYTHTNTHSKRFVITYNLLLLGGGGTQSHGGT